VIFWSRNIHLPAALIGTVATIALVQPRTVANTSQNSNWYQYQAKDKSYLVNFPQQPQEREQFIDTEAGQVRLVEAIFSDDRMYYASMHMDLPQQVDPEVFLSTMRDTFAQAVSMSIVNEKSTTISGLPAKTVEMKNDKGSVVTHLVFDPNGPTFYQVYVGSAGQTTDTPESNNFLNSLTIQPKK
jgi:hypothetical protein